MKNISFQRDFLLNLLGQGMCGTTYVRLEQMWSSCECIFFQYSPWPGPWIPFVNHRWKNTSDEERRAGINPG